MKNARKEKITEFTFMLRKENHSHVSRLTYIYIYIYVQKQIKQNTKANTGTNNMQ